MADKPNITREGYVERLVQTGFWATPQNPIQYAFLLQQPAYLPDEPGWEAFSAAQRAAVERAFAIISEVVTLTFVEVADNQQQPGPDNPRIAFYANNVELDYSGSMYAHRVDDGPAIHGADIRFNTTRIAQRQSNEGWWDFTSFVALHEVLHAMGLSHPGNYNGQGFNYQDAAEFVEDTVQYSVMSYFGASNTGADHTIGSVLYGGRTPLLYDILALHSLYSPNMATRAGDTVYGFNSNTGADSPFNFAVTTGPVVAIWDGGGIDTIDLSGYSGGSLIDLNEGAFSNAGGLTKNIAIAFNVTIENAVGGPGQDQLIGNSAGNRLDGGSGADQMAGGAGDDVYVVDDSGDAVVEAAGAGRDEVRTALAAYVLAANAEILTGTSPGAQSLTGNGLANTISGGGGDDSMAGGAGDDLYLVEEAGDSVVEQAGEGTDEVRTGLSSHVLAANVERLTGLSAAGQALTGNGLANVIAGGGGNDTLDGGAGADQLAGGLGNDLYIVGAGDSVSEAAGAGTDEVRTLLAAHALAANVENLRGMSSAGQVLTGNAVANVITGGSGNDTLDGGGAADTLAGGLGNDIYIVGGGDGVTEAANAGIDEVRTSLSSFGLGANLERLTGTSASGQLLTGNGLANLITGGIGNDRLDGGAGGSDTLAGGLGNDVYILDSGDAVNEAANAGTDEVRTALAAYTLTANVERLTGTSASGQVLTGNGIANIITGGSGNDRLDGSSGADTLAGGLGNDVYIVGGGDGVSEAANAGTDEVRTSLSSYVLTANIEKLTGTSASGQVLTGNGIANIITGGSGNDRLDGGGGGADTLAGGLGNDVYVVGGGDGVTEAANAGTDEVRTALSSYTLVANVEHLLGTSASGQRLVGNGLANTVTGGAANDTLDGAAGNDTLRAGGGSDVLIGGGGADSLAGQAGADIFRYDSASDSASGLADLIGDFQSGLDRIDLSRVDANSNADGDQAFSWIGSNAFGNVAGELRTYDSGGYRWIAGDTDGDGDGDILIAFLIGSAPAAPGDFML